MVEDGGKEERSRTRLKRGSSLCKGLSRVRVANEV